MGESIAVSLEREALATLGPVDIVLRAQRPFEAGLIDDIEARVGAVEGAATLAVTGSAVHDAKGLAEAFATIRGVGDDERAALGPLPGGAPEPAPGEVILSESLAESLGAKVGDRVRLRAPPPGGEGSLDTEIIPLVGTTATPPQLQDHRLDVREDALGLGAEVTLQGPASPATLSALSPSGIRFANESANGTVRLLVEPPVEPGTWRFIVESDLPAAYAGGAGVAYLPAATAAGAAELEARVAAIAPDEGRAALTGRPTALVPLGDLQRALDARGEATHAYFRLASGDPYAAVEDIKAMLPDETRDAFDVSAEKADRIAQAAEAGAEITGFLLVMGGFTLLAAVLLAFTLFGALVEERRAELGIMRALGLTRGEVALGMTLEGGLYAAFAALAGLALGLALLWGLMTGLDTVSAANDGPRFGLHVGGPTLVAAFLLGSLIPLATIGVASLRFARLDPARAIRGIPDDPKGRRSLGLVFAAAMLVAGALASLTPTGRLLGIPLLLAAVATALVALGRPRSAALPGALAALHLVWSLYAYDGFPEDAGELDPIFTLARGALLALGLSAVAVASARPYERLARLLAREGRPRRASFVALKYLVSRRRPAGLTMAMISLVVVVVTVMGTLFAMFGGSIPDHEAGYHVLGDSPLALDGFPRPLPPDLAADVERADFLPRHIEYSQANVTRDGAPIVMESGARAFLGVTPGFAQGQEYELALRAGDYESDAEVWEAVAGGEAILFPDWALEEAALAPGDRVTLRTAVFGPREYVVAGAVRSEFAWQTFIAADDVRAMGFPQASQAYVRVAPGADPDVVANRLTALYAEDGVTFTSIPEEVRRITATLQALVLVFEAFLALGLFVGLAATGFLASRAVHERMRDIGTLRALGYEERDVQRAFVLESTLTSAVGLALGLVVGLVVAHSIWWREVREDGIPFSQPWLLLALFAAAVLGLAALASRGPARRAAALPPAIAVRHVE